MKGFDVAAAGTGVMEDAVKEAHRRGTVQAANIGLGFVEPLDAVLAALFGEREVFGPESEFGQDVFHGDASTTAFRKPRWPIFQASPVLFADGFPVVMHHHFEQMYHGCELAGA